MWNFTHIRIKSNVNPIYDQYLFISNVHRNFWEFYWNLSFGILLKIRCYLFEEYE